MRRKAITSTAAMAGMMVLLTVLCFSCVPERYDNFATRSAIASQLAARIIAGPLLVGWLLIAHPGGVSLNTLMTNLRQLSDENVFAIIFLTLPSILAISAYVHLRTTETLCVAIAIWLGTGWFLGYGLDRYG